MSDLIPPRPKKDKKVSLKVSPEVSPEVKTEIIKEYVVPEYSELIKFCEQNRENDIDIEQFFKHSVIRSKYKEIYGKDRGGGGWVGAVRGTLRIIEKMKKRGFFNEKT